MEEKARAETQKFREDAEKKINSFIKDDKIAKLEFPPLEKFQVCLCINFLILNPLFPWWWLLSSIEERSDCAGWQLGTLAEGS